MIKRVSDIGNVITGKTPSSRHPEHFGIDLPFITPSDMDGRRRIELPERWLSEAGASALRSRIVQRAVGVSCIGWQMGKSVLIDKPSVTNQQLNSIVPNESVDLLFVYYSMLAKREDIFRRGSGGSRTPILNKTDFERLELWVPTLDVQCAVSGVLGALDDKIELNRRSNRNIETLAEEFFRSWFVNFDPVAAKRDARVPIGLPTDAIDLFPSHFEESALGPIPRGWRLSTIGAEVTVVGGSTPSTNDPNFWNGDVCWLTPRDLSRLDEPVVFDTERHITQEGLGQISSGLLPVGTVLLSSRAPIGYLAIAEVPVAVNQGFIAMKCDKQLSSHFSVNWVRENLDEVLSRAGGTTFAEISKAAFRPIPLVVPPPEVLQVFDTIIAPLHAMRVANARESRTLAALRDTLLGPLVSGELTTKSAEQAVAAAL